MFKQEKIFISAYDNNIEKELMTNKTNRQEIAVRKALAEDQIKE